MNVSLPPELERFVEGEIESGRFQTVSEVVREGLRLLKEQVELDEQKLVQLRRDVQVGIDEADRGEAKPLSDEWASDAKKRGRERLAARKAGS
ncbi:type II toxin-antitoxin system ParD family antitoxin [Paludisphaera rhizosphaerae]|uniref:type II toxin-antitoxin system ParD family antitoxin n=1 Tax=Paludisphaera rhizosphaerae TaxID=2711216 RepID=UPI0013EB92B3|nr:type II toxin-antitoxin system ParD family antitoxin [Paludisphaera rhizosphaerae]